jgi:tricorn protease
LDLESYEYVEIPHQNASDTFPCWLGDMVYFMSDRDGTMNVYGYSTETCQVQRLTHHEDFDVRSLTAGAGMLAYEQGGRVHLYDPETLTGVPLSIRIAADLPYTRPHYRHGARYIRGADLSPTGARAVFEVRGEIMTVPAKKGNIRNLTRTPGAHERYPSWSPDGQRIAYLSDAGGEYELVLADQTGLKEKETISLGGAGYYYWPRWSPDGKRIAYTDKALNLYYIDLEEKKPVRIDTDTYDHVARSLYPVWSPDSKWIAYTKRLETHIRAVFLYELATGTSTQITDGLSDATDPCFDPAGRYLYFAASSDYGLNTGWLDMSSYERPVTRNLYAAVLSGDAPSPLAPESDDEPLPEPESDDESPPQSTSEGNGSDEDGTESGSDGDEQKSTKKPKEVKVQIDLEGLSQRIVALPMPARNYSMLQAGEDKLYYLEHLPHQFGKRGAHLYTLHVYDLKERKCDALLTDIREYWLSRDGKKMLYEGEQAGDWNLIDTKNGPDGSESKLKLKELKVYVDPRAEWQQMFDEVYRIQRDFFYDAHMHGLDWKATCDKYRPFLEHVGHRSDLNVLFMELFGELVVGHAYVQGGDTPGAGRVPGGLLGADLEVADGLYRIRRIYAGLNWHPELRSPLTEPGIHAAEGEYILAIDGHPLDVSINVHSLLVMRADKTTELLLSPVPVQPGEPLPEEAHRENVVPLKSETALRHWSWVEGNRKRVDELSGGRVAYVYMTNTSLEGYQGFNRYYFSQLDKQAVVIDERFNGGGSVADYVIDMLDRPLLCHWATREGKPFHSPNASIFGPKVMIVNEYAGSGGDAMPLFFRRRGLGKLVGKRTWGGLVGIYDYPVLMDGGYVTAPRMAIFSPDNEWEVENVGVSPDVEVEMTPKLVIAGQDPQLEKAVEIVLAELEANPAPETRRPPPAERV